MRFSASAILCHGGLYKVEALPGNRVPLLRAAPMAAEECV